MGRVSLAAKALSKLELPEEIPQILERSRYWTEVCLRTYLELCDEIIFEDAQRGLRISLAAPRFLERIPKLSASRKALLRIRVMAVLGSAYRATGQLWEAEKHYRAAIDLAAETELAAGDRADLCCRRAVLCLDQKNLGRALELAEEALKLHQEDGRSRQARIPSHGELLLIRGVVHLHRSRQGERCLNDALQDFSRASTVCHPRREKRVFFAAVQNMAVALLEGAHGIEELKAALQQVDRAQKLLRRFRVRRRTIADAKLRWVRGLILIRFGSTQRAEQLLSDARQDLIRLGASREVVLISLDLAELFLDQSRWGTLRLLAEEVLELFPESTSPEIFSALLYWQHAVLQESFTSQSLDFLRDKTGYKRV